MIAERAFSLAGGQLTDVRTEPIRLLFHLAAEVVVTAIIIASWGFTLLTDAP